MKQKKITTIEDFAALMQQEFLAIHSKMDKGFSGINKRFDRIEDDIKAVKRDMEDLKLRMTEVAFKFEMRDLEKRVKKLELRLAR